MLWCACRRRWAYGGRRCLRPAGDWRVQPELLKRVGLDAGSRAAGTDAAWESSVGWVGQGALLPVVMRERDPKARPGAVLHVPGLGALGSGRLRPAWDAAKLRGVCWMQGPPLSAFRPPSPLPPVMCGPRVLVHVFSCCALARPSGQSACVLGLSGPAGEQGGAVEVTCAVGQELQKATCCRLHDSECALCSDMCAAGAWGWGLVQGSACVGPLMAASAALLE